jgi:hypothetical protein
MIARLSQEEVRAITAELSREHLAMGHPAAAQVPHRTAEQKAQVGPQLSPGLATAGVPHSVVPSEQDPDIYPACVCMQPCLLVPAVCLVLCLCLFCFCLVCALVIAALLVRQPGYRPRLSLCFECPFLREAFCRDPG